MNPATTSFPDHRMFAPAARRNRDPIFDVLKAELPAQGTVLEIASGTGQHISFWARQFPELTWIPSDFNVQLQASIMAWTAHHKVENVKPPLQLDVRAERWGIEMVDAILCVNMIHISPWEATEALFAGAAKRLPEEGLLYTYGPYRIDGAHTAPSNESFEQSLKERDARWGIRDLEVLQELGQSHALVLERAVPMPANNFSLVFRRHTFAP